MQLTDKELLDRAHEIRKFEIDLYWRRTAYFWTLTAAVFIGFFTIQASEGLDGGHKKVLSVIVGNLGFVFSFGWFLINRGSKFWQQNWEAHVDMLEADLKVALYRSVAIRKEPESWLVGSKPYSVSKINQIISFYVTVIWGGLLVWSYGQWFVHSLSHICAGCIDAHSIVVGLLLIGILVLTITTCLLFHCRGRTKLRDKGSDYRIRLKTRTPEQ